MNVKFISTREKLPPHHQWVFVIKDENRSFDGTTSFDLIQIEWDWTDDDGFSVCHDGESTVDSPPEGHPYLTILDANTGENIWTNVFNPNEPVMEHIFWFAHDDLVKQLETTKP